MPTPEYDRSVPADKPEHVVKNLPAVGRLVSLALWKSHLSFDRFCDLSRRYEKGHVVWEWVRKQEAVANFGTDYTTGAEKFFIYLRTNPQDVAITIADIGQRELDTFTLLHRYDGKLKRALEKSLHGEDFSDPRALEELDTMFGAALGRLRAIKDDPNISDAVRRHHTDFMKAAREKADLMPPIIYSLEHDGIHMTTMIPAKSQNQLFDAGAIVIPNTVQDGMMFMREIGRMSHPMIRTAAVMLQT